LLPPAGGGGSGAAASEPVEETLYSYLDSSTFPEKLLEFMIEEDMITEDMKEVKNARPMSKEEKATYGASVKIYAKLLRFGVCMTEEEYEKVRSS